MERLRSNSDTPFRTAASGSYKRRPSGSGSKRLRRGQNELIWVQPRTVPLSILESSKRLQPLDLDRESSSGLISCGRGGAKQRQEQTTSHANSVAEADKDKSPHLTAELHDVSNQANDSSRKATGNDVHASMDLCTALTGSTSTITPDLIDGPSFEDDVFANYQMCTTMGDNADDTEQAAWRTYPANDTMMSLVPLNGFSAIHLAAHLGNVAMARLLFSPCPYNADVLTPDLQTPLHVAASRGHIDMTRELLLLGANAARKDNQGHTPLHLAVKACHAEIARLLVNSLKDPQTICATDSTGMTPLHYAVVSGQEQIAQLLLESGVDPRTPIG